MAFLITQLLTHSLQANPWKVAVILEELNLPYTMKILTFAEMKEPEYLAINPNGKAPAINDPNTGVTLWEVSVISKYTIFLND
jgi:glutathione S-transferase